MKKFILSVFCLALLLVFPLGTFAKSYVLADTDISIDIPDDWYVFTRDNIKDNPYLSELQIDYEYIKNILETNYSYLDAFIFYEDGVSLELFVRVKKNDVITNLSNYSDDVVMEISEALAEETGSTDYDIYVEDYKYALSKYKDAGLNLIEYYTIVNGNGYTITVQKPTDYTESDEKLIESIINTIVFDVDSTLNESSKENSFDDFIDSVIGGILIGAVVGGISGGIIALIKRKNKNNNLG